MPYLCVDLVDDPLETLSSLAGVQTNLRRQHLLHVVTEWDTFHCNGGLLSQQGLVGIRRMRLIVHRLVYGDEIVEGHVYRLQGHLLDDRIHG